MRLSHLGVLFLLALLVPNLLWGRHQPRDCGPSKENFRLGILERAGQIWLLLPGVVILGIGRIGIHVEERKKARP